MGSSGIVGPSITLAAGAGYTAKLLKTSRVAVPSLGWGGQQRFFPRGDQHGDRVGFAGPVVCENNLYATEVAFAKATRNTDIAARARA